MKFINYLESISGVAVYPFVAMIIFGGVFLFAVWNVFFTRKETINEQSRLPLED